MKRSGSSDHGRFVSALCRHVSSQTSAVLVRTISGMFVSLLTGNVEVVAANSPDKNLQGGEEQGYHCVL